MVDCSSNVGCAVDVCGAGGDCVVDFDFGFGEFGAGSLVANELADDE